MPEREPTQLQRPRRFRLKLGLAVLALLVAVAAAALFVMISRAQPTLRAVVIDTLSARFKSKVELDDFHVSLLKGLQVSGTGLRIFGPWDPNNHEPGIQPILSLAQFRFRMSLGDFLHWPKHVDTVYVDQMILNLPPREQRQRMTTPGPARRKIEITVNQIVCDRTKLILNTLKPGKLPLEFDIASLRMTNISPEGPLHFEAELTNPKPLGRVRSSGSFGPWQPDDPRSTPVSGTYTFQNADLATIHGIGGTLSSTGKYQGPLDQMAVDGTTETPDFRIAISGRAVPLHTEFHAIVDGATGDTYLQPVRARILNTWLTARGSVVRVKSPPGHAIVLDVDLEKGKIDDILKLAIRTDPPIMTGTLHLHTRFDLQPGEPAVSDRLRLSGNFAVSDAYFSNQKIQDRVDALSMRSQGKPKLAHDGIPDNIHSDLKGTFRLDSGVLSFSQMDFRIPGTQVNLTGTYSLDGSVFDFHGKVRIDAKLSHMVTGWKSVLLKPADPFFSKHGAGTELPVRISGTKSEPHFGVDFGHKEKGPKDDATGAPDATTP